VIAHGAGDGFAWLHAGHDAWRFLPGRPRHERLLLLTATRLVVLDRVRGGGRHRIRNAVHLHPDAPTSVRIDWIPTGEPPVTGPAPLYERFNETREMTEIHRAVDVELSWWGGYSLGWDRSEELAVSVEPAGIRAETEGITIEWRSGSAPSVTSAAFEATPGSAT